MVEVLGYLVLDYRRFCILASHISLPQESPLALYLAWFYAFLIVILECPILLLSYSWLCFVLSASALTFKYPVTSVGDVGTRWECLVSSMCMNVYLHWIGSTCIASFARVVFV